MIFPRSKMFISLGRPQRARGASLVVVLLLLVIVTILGVGGAQIALLSERSARNDRDANVAYQGAQAGLMDAETDISGIGPGTREAVFSSSDKMNFVLGCGETGIRQGLCESSVTDPDPWLRVNFEGSDGKVVDFGTFTGRVFDAASAPNADAGLKPKRKPRYMIEVYDSEEAFGDKKANRAKRRLEYRVTAMGFGPRADSQAVAQMLFRKE